MLIDIYCPFYNEEKIVKQISNYWKLLPIRQIILFDNNTTDSSLKFLQNEFKNVRIVKNSENTFNDLNHMNFKNSCWKESIGKVDFVLVSDFDEVIWSPNIIKSLEKMKNDGGTIAEMVSFGIVCEDEVLKNSINDNSLMHLQNNIRFSYHNNLINHKKILFDPNKITNMNFSVGSHKSFPTGVINHYKTDLFLFHFSSLGKNFLIEKWKRNSSRLSKTNKIRKWGFQYQFPPEQIMAYFNDLMKNSFSWKEILEKTYNELINY